MVIITSLGIDVKDYCENYLSRLENINYFCEKHPGQRMAYHATYYRTVKDTGEKIPIQRFICYECKKAGLTCTMSILPDFLMPRKQYSATEIKSVISQSNAGIKACDITSKADISTVRRWINEISTQDGTTSERKCHIIAIADASQKLQCAKLSISQTSDEKKASILGCFDCGATQKALA